MLTQNLTDPGPFMNVTVTPRAIASRASSIRQAFVLPIKQRGEGRGYSLSCMGVRKL